MSIWNRIIAGAAEFPGVARALVGGLLGDPLDEGAGGGAPDRAHPDQTRSIAFTIGVIALSAKMAKADGVVTRAEIEAFREVFEVPPGQLAHVERFFDQARRDVAGYETYARQIARLLGDRPTVLEQLLGSLFHIARAEGVIHPAEL